MKRIVIFLTCALFTLATGMLYAAGKGDGGGRSDNWNRQSLEESTRGAERAEQRRADDSGMTSQQLMQREREREREKEQAKAKGQDGKGSMNQEQEREREREKEQVKGQEGKGSLQREQEREREREQEQARSGKKAE